MEALTQAIYQAVREVLTDLFQNGEHYYYITLVSDGGANTPCVSAWSHEALDRAARDAAEREDLKWSYADSPYCCWKQEAFEPVQTLLLSRGNIWDMEEEDFEREYELRYGAMEEAMRRLDREGVFSANQLRENVVVLVEVMSPDYTNTQRAHRLNSPDCKMFLAWLEEAAE